MYYVTIYWTSEDCDGQAILTLHLSIGQVILFPYVDHCQEIDGEEDRKPGGKTLVKEIWKV